MLCATFRVYTQFQSITNFIVIYYVNLFILRFNVMTLIEFVTKNLTFNTSLNSETINYSIALPRAARYTVPVEQLKYLQWLFESIQKSVHKSQERHQSTRCCQCDITCVRIQAGTQLIMFSTAVFSTRHHYLGLFILLMGVSFAQQVSIESCSKTADTKKELLSIYLYDQRIFYELYSTF